MSQSKIAVTKLLLTNSNDEQQMFDNLHDDGEECDSEASTPRSNVRSSFDQSRGSGVSRLDILRMSSDNDEEEDSSNDSDPSTSIGFPLTPTPSPKMEDFNGNRSIYDYFNDIPMITSPRSDYSESTVASSVEDDSKSDVDTLSSLPDRIEKLSHKFPEPKRSDEISHGTTTNASHRPLVALPSFPSKLPSQKGSASSKAGPPPLPISASKRQPNDFVSPRGLIINNSHNTPQFTQHHAPHPLLPSAHPFQAAAYPHLKSLSSPVLKVFNQQPLRFFPSSATMINSNKRRELKSESLEASTEGLREIRLHSMPRAKSFHLGLQSIHSTDSVDTQTSASLQPIYVFHNMNTMQQRLGIPHGTTNHTGTQNGILSNYYYYQNNPTVSLSNSNNEMIATAQASSNAREPENRVSTMKADAMAKNVANAGENHLSLLHEACVSQYDEIVGVLNSFQHQSTELSQIKSSMGIALDHNSLQKSTKSDNQLVMQQSMVKVSQGKNEMFNEIKTDSASDPYVPLITMSVNDLSNSKSLDSGRAMGGTKSSSYQDDGDECDDIFNFEDRLSLDACSDNELSQNDPSVVLLRYLDILSAFSEVLQLQSKEHDALNVLLQSFAFVTTFVKRSFPEPLEAMVPEFTPPAKIKLEEPSINSLEKLIHSMLDDYNRSTEIHLRLGMPLFVCMDRLAYHTNMHLLYAIINAIRRFAVLLKWNYKLDAAAITARASVSVYQCMSNAFEEHRVDLQSAYSLLASILEEVSAKCLEFLSHIHQFRMEQKGSTEESLLIDRKALDLSSQLLAATAAPVTNNLVPFSPAEVV